MHKIDAINIRIRMKSKGNNRTTSIRPELLYGFEYYTDCWACNKLTRPKYKSSKNMNTTSISWMSGNIRNENKFLRKKKIYIHNKIEVAHIKDKGKENRNKCQQMRQ